MHIDCIVFEAAACGIFLMIMILLPTFSHSAVYDDASLSMYVFGGCTSASTTFNDLWRLDLTNRWGRMFSLGFGPIKLIYEY